MLFDKTTQQYLKKYSPVPSNYDVTNLLPYVSIAEKIWVIPIIGNDLYQEIDEQLHTPSGGTLTPENATLLTESGGLWQYLAFATLLEGLPFIWVSLTEAGLQLGKSDNSDSVSLKDLTLIQTHIRNQVIIQRELLVKYLCSHTDSFPLFDTSVCPDCQCSCGNKGAKLYSTPKPVYKPTKGCVSSTMVSSTSSSVDLSNYYTKSETDELIDEKIDLSAGFRIIPAKARLQGDVNDDGYISITDETALSDRIRKGEGEFPESNYDVSLDGVVSIYDMTLENNLILGRGELPLVVFDENPYLAVVNAFEDGKVPIVKATVGSKVYPMIVYKASSGLVNNDYTTYLSSAIYNDNLTLKVEYKEDSTYGVLSSNDIDLSNYYTKEEVESAISSSVSSSITGVSLNGTEATVVNNVAVLSDIMTLPSVTSDDNGKILMVVDGQWALVNPTPPEPSGYSSEYLTFVAEADNMSVGLTNAGNTFQYSTDDGLTWSNLSSNLSTTSVNSGQKIMFKATSPTVSSRNGIGTLKPSVSASVEGNVMSLIYGDNFIGQEAITSNQFRCLFSGATNITSAEHLVLPSTTLDENCYQSMFNGCTSLTTAPELPATTLALMCYYSMFYNCSSLNSITCLATDISASNCTYNWVRGVSSSGTFTKASSMTSWIIGESGIPNLWLVVNA